MGKSFKRIVVMVLVLCMTITTATENVSAQVFKKDTVSSGSKQTVSTKPEKHKLTKRERVI